jgi:hypothetical protein
MPLFLMIQKELHIMMPQMEANQPIHQQSSAAYGAYEGNSTSSQQQYEAPYQQPPQGGTLDDNFVEAVAQRITQRMSQSTTGKVREKGNRLSPTNARALQLFQSFFLCCHLFP